jgi:hypothetical protein
MSHLKNSCLFVLLLCTFIGCTEIYSPATDAKAEALVVEGLITDAAGPFNIKLSKTVLYSSDSVSAYKTVLGAILTVTDNENQTFDLIEAGNGNYTLPSTFKGKTGNSYKLHIETKDGNIYESSLQKLLPPQTYDSIRGIFTSNGFIGWDNELKNVNGGEILVDLFKSVPKGDSVPLCRFKSNVTIQYNYYIAVKDTTTWHWVYNDWQTFQLNSNENITEDISTSNGAVIKNHSLGVVPIDMSSYGLYPEYPIQYFFYYLRIEQYTLNRDSYNFYKNANSQLAATGKIFDPVTAQLNGNMKCINNQSAIVLGLFEVSSVIKTAALVNQGPYIKSVLVKTVPYVDIPSTGTTHYKEWISIFVLPPFGDPDYISTIPVWWWHF